MLAKTLLRLLLLPLLASCGDKSEDQPQDQALPAIQAAPAEQVVALGRIEPENKITALAAQASGVVQRLLVPEGQTVTKGALLLELNRTVEEAQVRQAQSRFGAQEAQITADRAALRRAEAQADNLRRTAERVVGLAAQGAETQQSADDARTEAAAQQQEVARLRGALSASERQLAQLRSDVAVARAQLQQREVRALAAGTVLRWDVVPGGSVSTSAPLGDFAPAGRVTALCEVDELFANRVRVGMAAYVRNQGANDTLATGTVLFAAPYLKQKSLFAGTAGESEDRRVREVRILLPEGEKLLLNSRVECVIPLPPGTQPQAAAARTTKTEATN